MTNRLVVALLFASAAACGATKTDPVEDLTGVAITDDEKADLPNGVRLLGSIEPGQTKVASYANPPRYRAYKFGGQKGDVVTVDVKSPNGDALAWVLDDSGKTLAFNDDANGSLDAQIKLTLPGNANPDIITYYVVFREYRHHRATFRVSLAVDKARDLYACKVDSDCVKVQAGCCPHLGWTAVALGAEDDYQAQFGCSVPQACPRIAVMPDYRVPLCNDAGKCELVAADDIACGGHRINPHGCPSGYECRGDALAYDGTGKCYQTCGGFAGFQCGRDGGTSSPDACVDVPNDGCDPAAGGADCPGFCHRCGNVAFRCTYGTDWLNCRCNPAP
jgi:hypothetical protein